MRCNWSLAWFAAGSLLFVPIANAQQTIVGKNLVVNGNAEQGPASNGVTPVASVPGWTRTGNADVVAYGDGTGATLNGTGVAPADHAKQYFVGGPGNAVSSLSQDIDVTSSAAAIDAGTVVFNASVYLGGFAELTDTAQMTVVCKSAGGQVLKSETLGPVINNDPNVDVDGLFLRRQIGLLPASTRKITVTLQFNGDPSYNNGSADSVSLVLNQPGPPQSVLGVNLIVNGDAEGGPSVGDNFLVLDVPGWSRTGEFDVDTWTSLMDANSPGPPNHGNNIFTGGPWTDLSTGYQDIDVSAAAAQIDGGSVQYAASAWLGGWGPQIDNAMLTVQFQDWSGKQLGSAVELGPVTPDDRKNVTGLFLRSKNGGVPVGTRQVHVLLTLTGGQGSYDDGYADNLSLVFTAPSVSNRPAIKSSGVVSASAFGGFSTIAPGSWVEIYGTNLSTTTRGWQGSDFNGASAPTSLDGVSVTVSGQKAFVDYVSPTQVNALVPSSVGAGPMQVVVTNSAGTSDPYAITVNPTQPGLLAPSSFIVSGKQYVVALLPDGSYAMPASAVPGVASRPAQPGSTIVLYGIGFGAVPGMSAGTLVSQANTLSAPFQIMFGTTPATLTYDGLAPNFTGLYQFNVVVPSVPDNDLVPLTFNLGGTAGTQTLYIAVHQ